MVTTAQLTRRGFVSGAVALGGAAVLGSGEVVFSLEADSLVAAALADTWHAAA